MKFILLISAIIGLSAATIVRQCSDSPFENISDLVSISNCKKAPCRLRKDTAVNFELKFKPKFDVESLSNSVNAEILGIPFPFVGVDGTSACDNIFKVNGTTKIGCPLKAHEEYVYKTKIDVLSIYPRVKIVVHWGLTSPKGDVICFEVPARITN